MATKTSIEIKAPIKTVYEVISDFESYSEFLSGIKKVEVLKKKGNHLDVQFTLDLMKSVVYSLKIELKPSKGLEWTFIKGDFMKDNQGAWHLKEVKKGLTLAEYEIDVRFGLLVPKSISDTLVANNLPKMMKEFKERAEDV